MQPTEGLPIILLIFLISFWPKLKYDLKLNTLVRLKSKFPLDGIPIVIGTACLLKQFHPLATEQLIEYIGQFIRCLRKSLSYNNNNNNSGNKNDDIKIKHEIKSILHFIRPKQSSF